MPTTETLDSQEVARKNDFPQLPEEVSLNNSEKGEVMTVTRTAPVIGKFVPTSELNEREPTA